MSNDFDIGEFKNTVSQALTDEGENDELDSTLVNLIEIIRLNEVAAQAMSDKARKDQIVKVLDKLYANNYTGIGTQ